MGEIKNIIKKGAINTMSSMKSYDLTSKLKSTGIPIPEMHKIEMPEAAKNMKLDIDPSVVKLPAGVTNYMSPLSSFAASLTGVKLPSEIGGVPLPTLPDLSSMTSKVDEQLASLGISTKDLGIRDVSDILKEPNIDSLKNVQFESPVDLNNMPDITKSLDGFQIGGVQGELDQMTKDVPGMDKIDLSKYF